MTHFFLSLFVYLLLKNSSREQQGAFVMRREVLDAEELRVPSMTPAMEKNDKGGEKVQVY